MQAPTKVGVTDMGTIPAADELAAADDHNFMLGFILIEKVK